MYAPPSATTCRPTTWPPSGSTSSTSTGRPGEVGPGVHLPGARTRVQRACRRTSRGRGQHHRRDRSPGHQRPDPGLRRRDARLLVAEVRLLTVDRPMIFLVPDLEKYDAVRGGVIPYAPTAPGPHVRPRRRSSRLLRDLDGLARRTAAHRARRSGAQLRRPRRRPRLRPPRRRRLRTPRRRLTPSRHATDTARSGAVSAQSRAREITAQSVSPCTRDLVCGSECQRTGSSRACVPRRGRPGGGCTPRRSRRSGPPRRRERRHVADLVDHLVGGRARAARVRSPRTGTGTRDAGRVVLEVGHQEHHRPPVRA